MSCSRATITKTYKCDKDGCLCIPTKGAARVCLRVNEMDHIVRCDCKCNTKCECTENCTFINTAGLTCICVCRDQNGRIKTCEDCSCQPKQAQTQSCKGSNEACCCNTGNEKCACLNCSCCEPGNNKCGKGSCVTTCKGKNAASVCECKGKSTCACIGSTCKSKQVDGSVKERTRQSTNCCGNCDETCKCSCVEQEDAFKAKVCARKACGGNCKCQSNANSCVCICKNKQGETVCCDDCKCDGTKTCDVEGCVCVRKESSCKCKSLETRCCGSGDEKCKCSGRKQEAVSKAKNCTGRNCKCQGNENSCVCVCKDNRGETICCDDCKCDDNNRCDKEGCDCIRKESAFKSVKINCCENCDENCKCSCAEKNAVIKPNCAGKACGENCRCQGNADSCVCICKNKQGETVCCDDCKCDNNNICKKKGCICVPKEDSCKGRPMKPNCCENCDKNCKCSCAEKNAVIKPNCAGKACGENCRCQGNADSCVCICKNKQGETVCCDDCKCDNNNICNKKGCICVPKEDSCKGRPMKPNCCENCDENCKCSCAEKNAVIKPYNCAGKACGENCKCQGNADSCVCICKNKQGETVCCDDCKCDNNNICNKKGCICVPKEDSCKSRPMKPNCCENCDENCKCSCAEKNAVIKPYNSAGKACGENCKCQGNADSCVCICKNKQGETVCCDDCKCDNNNICNKKGCICVPKEDSCKGQPMKPNCSKNCDVNCKCSCVEKEAVFNANSCAGKVCVENCMCQGNGNSCVCICKNKQGETVCCEDCKCENNNICDKKGCVCIRKESSCKSKSIKARCCEKYDENCKCCCVGQEVASMATCAGKVCVENCKCQGNADSCVCIYKNKQGETVCCDDCKCDKKGCVCILKEDSCKGQPKKANCCENCDAKCKCSCVEQEAVFNANSCAGKVCVENCRCQGNGNSCVCICKNKQGETVCCEDCKCDNNNIYDKKGCVCIRKESSCKSKSMKARCCEKYDESCKCCCVGQEVASMATCAGKACVRNCKCQGNTNSCVCVCKNNQGERICCYDCKCISNQRCDTKGCACVLSASATCDKSGPKCCC